MTTPRRALAGLLGAALAVAPLPVLAAGHVYPVVIRQMAFAPPPAHLRVGDVIEWANDDIFLHSATAKDHSFDVTLKPKARVRMPLTKAGTFDFICRYHPGMKGRLVVGP
ncbi:MAG: cupredoxin domain-containing protein [Phenylobacterium sp.]